MSDILFVNYLSFIIEAGASFTGCYAIMDALSALKIFLDCKNTHFF